ncbi:MAG: hypothetical protein MZV64_71910 [Ignavibacteriales bacterium]|nr:hypothetical protein [Ignavibacteriales bacterium]
MFENEATIRFTQAGYAPLREIPQRGVIVTARGDTVDFVSRFFCLAAGDRRGPGHRFGPYYIDSVLGRSPRQDRAYSHALVGPSRLAYPQLLHGERVAITGEAVTYPTGELTSLTFLEKMGGKKRSSCSSCSRWSQQQLLSHSTAGCIFSRLGRDQLRRIGTRDDRHRRLPHRAASITSLSGKTGAGVLCPSYQVNLSNT